METPYSHSRPPTFSSKKTSKPPPFFSSSSSSSSSTFNNGGGGGGAFFTTSYDDVFGGPPKYTSSSSSSLAPRPEDYSEIFGGFRSSSSSSSSSSLRSSSSIPVLDLPAVPDDIHSASVAFFDYSEVFGGFNAVDFAVPFDQLFKPCHGEFCDVDADVDDDQLNDHGSSDEAWTPIGTESLSDESDPFASSEKSQCFSSENSHQPLESKQFNVSYHKVNPGTSTSTPNTMHVAKLNGMPGYTCVLDESTSLREMRTETFSPVGDDIVIDVASPSGLPEKQARKTVSHASYDNTSLKSYDSDHRSVETCNATISHVKSSFASASNVNLRAEPSHVPLPSQSPPVVKDRNGYIGERSSSPIASEKRGLEASIDGNLPSFFDMEVDASSSAAASAAAMKDVMDKAQAKLKAAKESRDRKDRDQNRGKLHLETDVDGGENILGARDECLSGEIGVKATTDGFTSKVKNSAKSSHAKSASLNLPNILAGEQPSGVSGDIKVQAMADRGPSKVNNSAKSSHAKSVSQNLPDILAGEQPAGVSGDIKVQAVADGGPSKVNNSAKSSHAKSASQNLPNILAGEQPAGVSGDIKVQAVADGGPSKVKTSAKARHTKSVSQNLPDILAGDQPSGVSERLIDTKQGKKSSLSMDTTFSDAAGQWKEARQYYEFVNNDNTKIATQQPSSNSDAKAAIKPQVADDDNSDSSGEVYVPRENRRRLKATKSVSRQGYYEKMVKVAQEVHDNVIYGHVEPDKRSKCISQGNPKQQKSEFVREPERSEILLCKAQIVEELEDVASKGEAVMRSNNMLEKEESEKQSEACHVDKVEINAEGPHESMVKEESEIREAEMKESRQRDKGDDTVRETVEREGRDQRVKESWGRQRTESRVTEAPKQKKYEETRGVEDKTLKQPFEDVLIGDKVLTACEIEGKGCSKDLQQMKAANERLKGDIEVVPGTDRLQRACESPENNTMQNLQQRDEYENNPEAEVDGQRPKRNPQNFVELEKCQQDKEAPEQARRKQRLYEVSSNIWDNHNSNEGHEQNAMNGNFEKTMDHDSLQACELDETMKSDVSTKEELKDAKKSHIKSEWEDEDPLFDSSPDIELPTQNKHHKFSSVANANEKDIELNMSCKLNTPQKTTNGFAKVTDEKQDSDVSTRTSYDNNKFEAVEATDVRIDESQIDPTAAEVGSNDIDELEGRAVQASDKLDLHENNTKRGSACTSSEQTLEEEKKVAQLDSDPKVVVKDINVEGGEKRNLMGEGLLPVNHADKVRPNPGEGYNEHASKEEAAHPTLPEDKETFQKNSHQGNLGQSTERKGKIIDHSSSKKKDENKERDLEKERLQKLEEERDRLREREKDRMAVELAVREARDRAYADARDRAERIALERATDEARQKAMAEARERLEKACAEARERSLSDKGSEARLKAERAAVERANAEARQRAIEKTMADRATFEARERMQRSVSEKYISERDVIMRQSSFPTSSERFEASYGEPAQRCKARLERHRRTVERVANALAEKNMRDSLAQREQAERTRLAETLDGDIRRWSSGKEGNLRALLSTLQYILGPDSGWQPVPLTEVITAAAVKKAYRKATLCVHPDKLQQRGASIQQKYICEKVFDLLKEAWNRFNSEEK